MDLMLSLSGFRKHLHVKRNSGTWSSSSLPSWSWESKLSLRHILNTSLSSAVIHSRNDFRRNSRVILFSPNKHNAADRFECWREKKLHLLVPINKDSCDGLPFRLLEVMPYVWYFFITSIRQSCKTFLPETRHDIEKNFFTPSGLRFAPYIYNKRIKTVAKNSRVAKYFN